MFKINSVKNSPRIGLIATAWSSSVTESAAPSSSDPKSSLDDVGSSVVLSSMRSVKESTTGSGLTADANATGQILRMNRIECIRTDRRNDEDL